MISPSKALSESLHAVTACSQTFDVLVVGTMSSGKSSFINALIGHEILDAKNEASTACITSVEHQMTEKCFRGDCYSASGHAIATSSDISASTVRDWNANRLVKKISLVGRFKSQPSMMPGLVLHDTPGPNNSQDERHAKIFYEALRSISFHAIYYIINAGQLGINDDSKILDEISKVLAEKKSLKILFILNKVDLLDPEKGEDLESCLKSVNRYLVNKGFSSPIIVPVMANIALYARKELVAEPMTRAQKFRLRLALDEISDDSIVLKISRLQYSGMRFLDFIFRKKLRQRAIIIEKLKKLEYFSGMKAVEEIIYNHHNSVKKF